MYLPFLVVQVLSRVWVCFVTDAACLSVLASIHLLLHSPPSFCLFFIFHTDNNMKTRLEKKPTESEQCHSAPLVKANVFSLWFCLLQLMDRTGLIKGHGSSRAPSVVGPFTKAGEQCLFKLTHIIIILSECDQMTLCFEKWSLWLRETFVILTTSKCVIQVSMQFYLYNAKSQQQLP